MLSPITARPATPKPMTVPPVKATFRACFKLVRAACAVRTFAFVAMFIPMYPANAEVKAPMMKATPINQCELSTSVPDHANKTDTTAPKMKSTLHSAFKKARAPSAIAADISCILPVPASWATTQRAFHIINKRPMSPIKGTK